MCSQLFRHCSVLQVVGVAAHQRPDRHPNTLDEQGAVVDRRWAINQKQMGRKPVPNCPGRTPGQFGTGFGPVRIRLTAKIGPSPVPEAGPKVYHCYCVRNKSNPELTFAQNKY